MCGIAGIIGINVKDSRPRIENMAQKLLHRGPDAGQFFIDENAAFGHRRLAIIDLNPNANQPFKDVSGRYVIVYNGEIYNYKEIKAQINYPWQTNSDTEVILASYIQWGNKCLQYLNGMFAFAIWDTQNKELFMARDRIGVKPFYYYHTANIFVFSSEIRSMLESELIERKLSKEGLAGYLSGMAPRTPFSIINEVFQLLPGEFAILKEGELKKSIYWSLVPEKQLSDFSLTYNETVEKTRALFENSIKSRMVADVPVGAFLSGGIDSSAVVALMAKHSKQNIETFAITFNEKEFDESEYSRLVAKKFNTKHTELLMNPHKLFADLHEYLSQVDSPTVDGLNTWTVSKMVAETGIKVAVSGLGGDELFVGYPGFHRWKTIKGNTFFFSNLLSKSLALQMGNFSQNRATQKICDFINTGNFQLEDFYKNNRANFLNSEVELLLKTHLNLKNGQWINLNDKRITKHPVLSQYGIGELSHYTLDVLLKDTDQMSMAHSLEIREPFFDYKLIEFLLSVPDKFKYSKSTPKSLLVAAMGDLLPHEIINRPKKGFTFPWDNWFRNELRDYCKLAFDDLIQKELFDKHELEKLWQRFLNHDKRVSWQHIWTFVMLSKWMEINHIDCE